MKWLLQSGRTCSINPARFRIKFDKPSRSKEQMEIKAFLKQHFRHHILYEEFRIPGTRLFVDFLDETLRMAIEHQGVGHYEYNPFFHDKNKFKFIMAMRRDKKKRELLELNGYTLIETTKKDFPLTIDFIRKQGISI